MKFDENANKSFDHRYFVRSLYFDNIDSSNFYDKVDGIKINENGISILKELSKVNAIDIQYKLEKK